MIRLGIIGGVSYESTLHYYKRINEMVNQALGQLITADLVITSENFQIIKQWQDNNSWEKIGHHLAGKALGMKNMGVEKLVVSSATTHRIVPYLENETGLQVIHIGNCLVNKLLHDGKKSILFIGTKITVTQNHILEKLKKRGITIFVPNDRCGDIDKVDRIIFDELCKGIISEKSRLSLVEIIEFATQQKEIDAVVLGCTELGFLLTQNMIGVPLYDIAECHINAISELIIHSCNSC